MKNHNIVLFQTYNHTQNYEWILEGNYEKAFYCCTNYTAFDKTLAPEGKGILNILSLDHIKNWENLGENEYKEKKKRVINIIIKRFEEIYPELSKHIEVAELATPITMKKYTRNPEGAIYGASQIVEQSGINRLTPETPIQGLYLVGAYVYPGAGYSSVISSGYKTGKMILEKIRNN